MNYNEALEYIDGTQWFGATPSLRRIDTLMKLLNEPQKGLKFLHIAGTNGKGSCAAMLSSILISAGYRTGLFTSPYLFRFNERIKIDGKNIGDPDLALVVSQVREKADTMEEHPTEFELMTAAAMLYFAAQNCHIVVLETGLGGRFDATNVISAPECSIIMNIGLDHTAILGDTTEKIAFEKAGIIKKNFPCVLYQQSESVTDVIADKCREMDSQLIIADFSKLEPVFDSLKGQSFIYGGEAFSLPLLGAHQLRNAAVALEAAKVLRSKGWKLETEAVKRGLSAVSWPARFELCRREPDFIVDGGHNPQCIDTVAESLCKYYPHRRRVLLVGVLRDKNYGEMMPTLSAVADEFVTVTPHSPRALEASKLAEILEKCGKPVTACQSVQDAVDAATALAGKDGVVCAIGSLYLAGEVRHCLGLY